MQQTQSQTINASCIWCQCHGHPWRQSANSQHKWDRVGRAVTTVHSATLLLMSDRVDGMLSEYIRTPTPNHKWGSAMLSSPSTLWRGRISNVLHAASHYPWADQRSTGRANWRAITLRHATHEHHNGAPNSDETGNVLNNNRAIYRTVCGDANGACH